MTLKFIGGPIDGHSFDCPLSPPPVFFLPTKAPLTAGIYSFDSLMPGVLKYVFDGYCELTDSDAKELFGAKSDLAGVR